jgi:hypothetical protein
MILDALYTAAVIIDAERAEIECELRAMLDRLEKFNAVTQQNTTVVCVSSVA